MKSNIGNDAIKLSASQIITSLIALVSSMLLSRFRTLTEYGTYSQLLLVVNLGSSIIMLGLPHSINYFLAKARDEKERAQFLSIYYSLSTILSLIVGFVLVMIVPLLEKFFKNDLIRSFIFFLALFPWTSIILSSVANLLVVYHKTSVLFIFRLCASITNLGVILLVKFLHATFFQYMVLYLINELVLTIWVYCFVKKTIGKFSFNLDKKFIRNILAFSIPMGLASMLSTINIELDKMVITSFLSTEQLAIYTNASRELPVNMISSSLTAVLMPQMVRLLRDNNKEEAIKLWNSATSIGLAVISLIAVGCFVFAPEVMTILYSPKYLDGAGVFRVYSLVLLFRCTYFGMMLNALGITKFVFYVSLSTLILNSILNIVFFKIFGFIGPAIATLVVISLTAIWQLVFTCEKVGARLSKIFPWKNGAFYLLINIGLGILAYFIKIYINKMSKSNNVIIAVALGVIWALVYFLITQKQLKQQWKHLNG